MGQRIEHSPFVFAILAKFGPELPTRRRSLPNNVIQMKARVKSTVTFHLPKMVTPTPQVLHRFPAAAGSPSLTKGYGF